MVSDDDPEEEDHDNNNNYTNNIVRQNNKISRNSQQQQFRQETEENVAGIRLRTFEKVVSRILARNDGPILCCTSSSSNTSGSCSCWAPRNMYQHTSNLLPPLAPMFHNWKDQLQTVCDEHAILQQLHKGDDDREKKKYGQIQSIIHSVLCILSSLISSNTSSSSFTIVDFCGGSGSMAISLALLLSSLLRSRNYNHTIHVQVIVVDLKAQSLQCLHRRAATIHTNYNHASLQIQLERNTIQSTSIPNLSTFYGDIVSFSTKQENAQPFHIGIALHACGEATDVTLRACIQQQQQQATAPAAAFVLAPCCIGKLSTFTHDPHVFHATQQNKPTITYPQSIYYRTILNVTPMEFNYLAKAADYSSYSSLDCPTDAVRRVAQSCIDYDRLCYVRETAPHYTALLTKMEPLSSSPKNNILVGWVNLDNKNTYQHMQYQSCCTYLPETSCSAGTRDILWAIQQLNLEKVSLPLHWQNVVLEKEKSVRVSTTTPSSLITTTHYQAKPPDEATNCISSRMEWSAEEEHSIRQVIENFCNSDHMTEYHFPPGQGSRIRKLIHHIAEIHGLSHRSEGKQNSKRLLIIAKNSSVSK
jgi:hypothetical protein